MKRPFLSMVQLIEKQLPLLIFGGVLFSVSACRFVSPPNVSTGQHISAAQKTFPLPKPILATVTNTPRPTFTVAVSALPQPVPKQLHAESPTAAPIAPSATTVPTLPAGVPPTPTSLPPTPNETPTTAPPSPTATATPLPTATPVATPTSPVAPTLTGGWQFENLQQFSDTDDELTITGELVNNSGDTQTLNAIGGEFFDATGAKIAGDDDIFNYWLTDNIPGGGRLPFELSVDGIESAANFSLTADAEPAPGVTRTDFQVNVTDQSRESDYYCIEGTVAWSEPFNNYLEVIATGYAADGSIISFDDDYFSQSTAGLGSTVDFAVCLDDPDPPSIDHHTLQVWGE